MSDEKVEKPKEEDAVILQAYAKTRKSLIARLDNWEDQKTWDEFYQTYWRLIYAVAIKAGLRPEEAFDCVQETILSIAKQSKKKLYDPEQGSFKTWLMNMTRWRINDQFRKRKKDTAMMGGEWDDERKTRDRPHRGSQRRCPLAPLGRGVEKERCRRRPSPRQGAGFPQAIPDLRLLRDPPVEPAKGAGKAQRKHGAGLSSKAPRRRRAEKGARETGGRDGMKLQISKLKEDGVAKKIPKRPTNPFPRLFLES